MKTYDESSAITKPRRRRLRRVRRIGCGLLILLISTVCTWAWRHHSLQKSLDEALAELDRTDPGWRLEDIETARERIAEKENSARVVVAVAGLLPKNWPPKQLSDLFTHLAPEERLAAEDFAQLKLELEKVRPALEEARTLAAMPRGRHRITYLRNVLNTLLKDQAEVRRIVWLLIYDAMRWDQNGDSTNAMISCRAAFNAARSLGDEPLAISQLIRTSGIASVGQATERALAQGEPASEELAAFANLLYNEDAFPDLLITARGERADDQALFDAIESGDVSIAELADGRPGWKDRLFGFLHRDNIRAEHPTMLALMNQWVAIARLPMPEQADAEQDFNREVSSLPTTAILTRLLLPALTKLGEASRRKHALLRCTIVAFAAERYRRDHGTWPETMNQFGPNYLSALLLDPFDGQELRYRRVEDGLVIYSVGHDTVDNNGNLDAAHPNQPGVDIGCRLWDVAQRRQQRRPNPFREEKPR